MPEFLHSSKNHRYDTDASLSGTDLTRERVLRRERNEDGFMVSGLGKVALKSGYVILGTTVGFGVTVAAFFGGRIPDTSEEAKTISGTAELGKIIVHADKRCFWEYETAIDGTGERRAKNVETGILESLPGVPDDVEYMSATARLYGMTDTESCIENFEIKPKIEGEDVALTVTGNYVVKPQIRDGSTVKIERSALPDFLNMPESLLNAFGFEGIDDVKQLDQVMTDRARVASKDRTLDCLDEAMDMALPDLKEDVAEQWRDEATATAEELGIKVDLTKFNYTVDLPEMPIADMQNKYESALELADKKAAGDFTYEKGSSTKCDTGNAVVERVSS